MEAADSSYTPIPVYRNIRHDIPEAPKLNSPPRDAQISYIFYIIKLHLYYKPHNFDNLEF
jgi:hypothetical protein